MEVVRIIFHYYVRDMNATRAHLELKDLLSLSSILPDTVKNTDLGVNEEEEVYKLHYRSVAMIYKQIRYQIHVNMQNYYRRTKLGKYGRIVEIDESVFARKTEDGKQK